MVSGEGVLLVIPRIEALGPEFDERAGVGELIGDLEPLQAAAGSAWYARATEKLGYHSIVGPAYGTDRAGSR